MLHSSYSRIIPPLRELKKVVIDLSPIHELGNGNQEFLVSLISVYERQTPAFVEKLRRYGAGRNFADLKLLCLQIKSSYERLDSPELNNALEEIILCLNLEKPRKELTRIKYLVNVISTILSVINSEVKREVRKLENPIHENEPSMVVENE